ncbi:hypothetical protein R6Q59_022325 [Mikania micrantha]|uniref:Uncharacterized protein n=1 Tax=Mikania micrantha TaxID=192012 RepID=A0A5N6MXV0_9ASTR|nr:hypothetical protein E3N88_27305 [Mikania micrantha]
MAKTNGCNLSHKSSAFMVVLVILMLLVQGGSARLYACWGGCLNECFLLSSKQVGQRFPCYINCLAKCFYPPGFGTPSSPSITPPSTTTQAPANPPSDSILEADSEVYADSIDIDTNSEIQVSRIEKRNTCLMYCSLQTCGLYNNDEIKLKTCLLGCISKCKDLNV